MTTSWFLERFAMSTLTPIIVPLSSHVLSELDYEVVLGNEVLLEGGGFGTLIVESSKVIRAKTWSLSSWCVVAAFAVGTRLNPPW